MDKKMHNVDCPVTINVGGDIFMTSLTTVQTLPDTTLAILINTLHLNTDSSRNSSLKDEARNGKISSQQNSLEAICSNAIVPSKSRFIHVASTNCNNDVKPTQDKGETANTLCVQYQSAAVSASSATNCPSIFVDRNPILMPYILDLYRTGKLHLPANICSPLIRSELEFWGISEDLISPCCWKHFDEGVGRLHIIDTISKSLFNPYDSKETRDSLNGMEKVWITMERPSYSLAAKIWCAIYFMFIFISMLVFSLGSLPTSRRIHPSFKDIREDIMNSNKSVSLIRMMSFTAQIETIGITNIMIDVFFTVEFLVRLVTCPSKSSFLKRGHNILDMVILGVAWLNFLLEEAFAANPDSYGEVESHINVILSCCVVVRVLRVCHIAKHMPAMKLMYLSARESTAELLLLVAVVGSAVLMLGTAMFLVETFDKLPGDMGMFRHVPYAMWWAMVTITTVGYGDFYPTTTGGYFVGALCAMSGLLLIAMPIAIIATNFADFYYNMTCRDHSLKNEQYLKTHNLGHPPWCPGSTKGNDSPLLTKTGIETTNGKKMDCSIEDLENS